jgi:hypothetical protein
MPMMRRRGPGLLGMAARTAVVAGTATAVSNKVSDRHANKQQEQYEAQQYEAQQQAPPAPAPVAAAPAVSQASVIDQLKELAELKNQGILTEEEFAAQKAKLLA